MFPTYAIHDVVAADRRHRFEATASRRRLLAGRGTHRSSSAPASTGRRVGDAVPAIPLGRTPSEIVRTAA